MDNSLKSSTLISFSKQLKRPEHEVIALRNNQTLLVADLKTKVLQICYALQDDNNKCWAVSMQDSFNFVAGLLALFYLGKQPKLLNPNQLELNHYYTAILADRQLDNKLQTHKKFININQLSEYNTNDIEQFINNGFKQQNFTLFTSGSTGLPKPIKKSVSQLEQEIEILEKYWGILTNDLIIASVSHEHMYGLTFKIMLSLSYKIPFICEPVIYQEQLAVFNHKKIIYVTTPSIIKTLDNQLPIIRCEKVISSGGKLSYEESQCCLKNFAVLPIEIYGSSETGIIATRQQYQPDTAWQLFPSMQLEFDDFNQQTLLHSPLINKPEILNDKLHKISDNKFNLVGRKDKIIKISEKRVSLTNIETKMSQLKQVEQVFIIPLEQNNRTILGAVVKLSPAYQSLLCQYNHFKLTQYFRLLLKDTLSLIEIPKKWRFIEFMPKNSQGKSTYIELKALFDVKKE